ncbi:uncharacterized protein LOC108866022 isoform X2 [Pyrus x bretschneideri]|uniref:uncharacterized protein LOC108866022 isoform X2 n=1 Tax=Pyrus x bretschneideri TaxID=225117 RepID=UPI002030B715|nr:uncharacterized protein LOC108866022 isoform X2 [Pyrus x bretschneideri]
MTLKLKGWFDLGFQVAGKCWLLLLRSSTLIFYTSHRRSDPGSNPPNSVILCERIKDVGNLKPKSGSWKLISYDFGAEDPPRHVGNEGFRIFGERDRAIPEALPLRSTKIVLPLMYPASFCPCVLCSKAS